MNRIIMAMMHIVIMIISIFAWPILIVIALLIEMTIFYCTITLFGRQSIKTMIIIIANLFELSCLAILLHQSEHIGCAGVRFLALASIICLSYCRSQVLKESAQIAELLCKADIPQNHRSRDIVDSGVFYIQAHGEPSSVFMLSQI